MKKLLSLLLIIAMVFAFSACGTSEPAGDDTAVNEGTQTTDTNTEEPESEPEPEPVKEEDWAIGYYVDEFEEPTDDAYITNTQYIIGKFSNSATSNSELLVQVLVDDEKVSIFLYEYGDNLVKNSSSNYNEDYTITIRDESGEEAKISGAIWTGDDRISIEGSSKEKLINYLCGEEDFKVHIVNDEHTTTQYLFKVSPSNFAELY